MMYLFSSGLLQHGQDGLGFTSSVLYLQVGHWNIMVKVGVSWVLGIGLCLYFYMC